MVKEPGVEIEGRGSPAVHLNPDVVARSRADSQVAELALVLLHEALHLDDLDEHFSKAKMEYTTYIANIEILLQLLKSEALAPEDREYIIGYAKLALDCVEAFGREL